MTRVKIVVDSALDIPNAALTEYGVVQVPVLVHWQGKEYKDKVDMAPDQMFKKFAEVPELPTTSQPASGEFARVYKHLLQGADVILSFHIAASLSGTYNSAVAGAEIVKNPAIQVFDTNSVSMGGGLQALTAAKTLAAGGTWQEALASAEKVEERVMIHLVLDTLSNVLKGGRTRLEATLAHY